MDRRYSALAVSVLSPVSQFREFLAELFAELLVESSAELLAELLSNSVAESLPESVADALTTFLVQSLPDLSQTHEILRIMSAKFSIGDDMVNCQCRSILRRVIAVKWDATISSPEDSSRSGVPRDRCPVL
jgi:hypothetical protein